MNTHVYLVAFMAGVVMVAAGQSDVKKNAVLKRGFFSGSNVHPADMALPELISSLHEHLAALKDAIQIVEDLQNTGMDSTVDDLLNKLEGVPISVGTTSPPEYTAYPQEETTSPLVYTAYPQEVTITPPSSTTPWWDRRSKDRKRKLINELVLKKLRALAKEEQ